ncbi:hypothetical protein MKY34_12000 [Sporosarcina sp. FSL K6-1522]|uniref:hypothetical protein n=1 Tax=Sporosarcina sp. FSL K6-1522 TaxID=2921554 RepID=UPI00315A10FF
MKNDMRITYPLWQLGAIAILMVFVVLISYSADFTIYSNGGFEFAISFEGELGIVWGVISLIFVVYLVLFIWSIIMHNNRMPQHKIQIFSWKPQEYMEDDELFQDLRNEQRKKSILILFGQFHYWPVYVSHSVLKGLGW